MWCQLCQSSVQHESQTLPDYIGGGRLILVRCCDPLFHFEAFDNMMCPLVVTFGSQNQQDCDHIRACTHAHCTRTQIFHCVDLLFHWFNVQSPRRLNQPATVEHKHLMICRDLKWRLTAQSTSDFPSLSMTRVTVIKRCLEVAGVMMCSDTTGRASKGTRCRNYLPRRAHPSSRTGKLALL